VRSGLIRRLAAGLSLLLVLIAVFGSLHGCKEELPEGVIAQVGTAYISQDQLDTLEAVYQVAGHAPNERLQPAEYRSFKQQLVEYLVTLEVLHQEATTYGVTVTAADVDERIAQIKQMFLGDEQKFEAAVEEQNLTMDELTQAVKESLWLDKMKGAATEDVTVSEDEVQAYYDAHKAEYTEQESRRVRHILISPFVDAAGNQVPGTPSQDDWDAAKSEAESIRSEILNGADFVTEVEEYSDDSITKDSGGDLGAVIRGQTVPAFEDAVFSLQKNELSEPVKTPYGYHLIEVTDITPETELSYDMVKEKIRTMLLEDKQTAAWDEWLSEKKADLGVIYRDGYALPSALATSTTELSPGSEATSPDDTDSTEDASSSGQTSSSESD
jgi:parvulin-like peptidyl-prolyl isomerase